MSKCTMNKTTQAKIKKEVAKAYNLELDEISIDCRITRSGGVDSSVRI